MDFIGTSWIWHLSDQRWHLGYPANLDTIWGWHPRLADDIWGWRLIDVWGYFDEHVGPVQKISLRYHVDDVWVPTPPWWDHDPNFGPKLKFSGPIKPNWSTNLRHDLEVMSKHFCCCLRPKKRGEGKNTKKSRLKICDQLDAGVALISSKM